MNKKLIYQIIIGLLGLCGLVCIVLNIIIEEKDSVLLIIGLLCNSIALILSCVNNKNKKEN